MICSLLMLVFDVIGLHLVFAYFKMGQVTGLNVETIDYCNDCTECMLVILNLMIMLGIFVSVSLCMSLCIFTISIILLMPKATATVHCEGLGLLKPFVIRWQVLCKAVWVECLCLNPC